MATKKICDRCGAEINPISSITYLASSQKHKALFSTREKAEDACKHNPQYEPFRIEAEPVKHGRWKGAGMGDYSCSLCMEVVSGNENNYCPNCGAKMDGGAENE